MEQLDYCRWRPELDYGLEQVVDICFSRAWNDRQCLSRTRTVTVVSSNALCFTLSVCSFGHWMIELIGFLSTVEPMKMRYTTEQARAQLTYGTSRSALTYAQNRYCTSPSLACNSGTVETESTVLYLHPLLKFKVTTRLALFAQNLIFDSMIDRVSHTRSFAVQVVCTTYNRRRFLKEAAVKKSQRTSRKKDLEGIESKAVVASSLSSQRSRLWKSVACGLRLRSPSRLDRSKTDPLP